MGHGGPCTPSPVLWGPEHGRRVGEGVVSAASHSGVPAPGWWGAELGPHPHNPALEGWPPAVDTGASQVLCPCSQPLSPLPDGTLRLRGDRVLGPWPAESIPPPRSWQETGTSGGEPGSFIYTVKVTSRFLRLERGAWGAQLHPFLKLSHTKRPPRALFLCHKRCARSDYIPTQRGPPTSPSAWGAAVRCCGEGRP